MTKKFSSRNIPKLRFPEFSGEWEEKKIGEIGRTYNGLQGKSAEDFGEGAPYITYKQIFDSSKINTTKFGLVKITAGERQKTVKKGDVFFTTSSETPFEVGFASVLLENVENVYLNSFCFGLRIHNFEELLPEFARFLFRNQYSRKQMYRLAQGSTRYNMSKNEFIQTSILLPSSGEQQKVADFLTTVDVRIAGMQKKKELLEKYKKGVMQQIFNQKIRFRDKNAKDYPDWADKKLGDIGEIYQPTTISQTQLKASGYPVYGANGVIGLYDKFNHEHEQIAVTCRGNTCGAINFTRPKSWITGNAMVINLDKSKVMSKKFVYYQLKNSDLRYLITGSGQPQITGDIKQHRIKVPSLIEQRKIADFLTSIDQKIYLNQQALEQAKKFKKTLLQQMFI